MYKVFLVCLVSLLAWSFVLLSVADVPPPWRTLLKDFTQDTTLHGIRFITLNTKYQWRRYVCFSLSLKVLLFFFLLKFPQQLAKIGLVIPIEMLEIIDKFQKLWGILRLEKSKIKIKCKQIIIWRILSPLNSIEALFIIVKVHA